MSVQEILLPNGIINSVYIDNSKIVIPQSNVTGLAKTVRKLQNEIDELQSEINNLPPAVDAVPYTGADKEVNLNTQDLVVGSITNPAATLITAPQVGISAITNATISTPSFLVSEGLPLSSSLEVGGGVIRMNNAVLNMENNPISNVLSISTANISVNPTDALVMSFTDAGPITAFQSLDMQTNSILGVNETTTTTINTANINSENGTLAVGVPNAGAIEINRSLDLNTNSITGVTAVTGTSINATNYRSNNATAGLVIPDSGAIVVQTSRDLNMNSNNITSAAAVTASSFNSGSYRASGGQSAFFIPNFGPIQVQPSRTLDLVTNNITNVGTMTGTTVNATNYRGNSGVAAIVIPNTGAVQLQASRNLDLNTNNIIGATTITGTNINATEHRSNDGSSALSIPNSGAITCSRDINLGSNTLTGNLNSSSGTITMASANSGDGNICFAFGNLASVSYTYRNINFQGLYGVENTTFVDSTTLNCTNYRSRNGTAAIVVPNTGAIQLQTSRNLDMNTNNITNCPIISHPTNVSLLAGTNFIKTNNTGNGVELQANSNNVYINGANWSCGGTNYSGSYSNWNNTTSSNTQLITTGTGFIGLVPATGDLRFSNLVSSGTGTNLILDGGQVKLFTSSRRFKNNIVDIEVDSSKIYNLQAKTFIYNDKPNFKSFGYIAEDTKEILEEIVTIENDQPYSIQYQQLPVLIIEEMKKLRDEIVQLKSRVSILEGN